ncbi:MAG: hypothetical protein HEQ32_04980 [Vampirovibrio sp.]
MENVLFGLFDNGQALEAQTLASDQQTQQWLVTEFEKQKGFFLSKIKEEKDFDPHGITHDDELYRITTFTEKALLDKLLNDNQDSFNAFNGNDFNTHKPKALGIIINSGGHKYVCLQHFTQKNILSSKGILGFKGNTLEKNKDYLIGISNHLSAIYIDGMLKFKSFHAVKQIFDMKNYYIELSNDQIEQVVNSLNNFTFQDREATLKSIAQKTRKLFSALSVDDYVKKASAGDLKKKVEKDTGLTLTIEKGMICLPKDSKDLFAALNSMLGNIYEDERTNECFTATSKEKFERT